MVVDDVCTMGGTLANLVQYIETSGGKVISLSVLADGDSTPEAKKARHAKDFLLNPSQETKMQLVEKYGREFEQDLYKKTGLKYDTITDREALFLLHQDTDEVREFILQTSNTQNQSPGKRRN